MNKTAVIDIDNTLWQFSDAFYMMLKEMNENFPEPGQWVNSQFWKGYCSEADFMAAINSIHQHQDSERYQPYPESQGFLSSLKKHGFHVIIASHRSEETRGSTGQWLAQHGLPYDELHLSFNKTVLFPQADVVVDDAPLTLKKAVESGALATGLIFPWNRVHAGNGFKLFPNLDGVLEHILNSNLNKGD